MKYERLTDKRLALPKNSFRQAKSKEEYIELAKIAYKTDGIEIYSRLAELEDKIVQGTLIELPCKVGDILYTNFRVIGDRLRNKAKPYPVEVIFIGINNDKTTGYGFINVTYGTGRMWQFNFSDFGTKIFLTRKETETILNGKESKENKQ